MPSDSSDDEHRLDERVLGEWIYEQLTTQINFASKPLSNPLVMQSITTRATNNLIDSASLANQQQKSK
jgi:hypothetical protein